MAIVKETHGLLARLRRRPLSERKAMFFATFIVASALVLSFWTNQMYRRFGIVFLGSSQTSEVVTRAPQTTPVAREAGGLKKPFELARENLSLLKEDFINLFSSLSSELKTVSLGAGSNRGALNNGETEKEPPLAALGTAAETALLSDADVLSPATLPPQPPENTIAARVPPLPQASAGAKPVTDNPGISDAEQHGDNQSNRGVGNEASAIKVPAKAPSRVAAIIMTNLAAIRQAFRDFYQYLTQ